MHEKLNQQAELTVSNFWTYPNDKLHLREWVFFWHLVGMTCDAPIGIWCDLKLKSATFISEG